MRYSYPQALVRAQVWSSKGWRGDGVAERASLENWRPRKGSASSNLAPSAIFSRVIRGIGAGTVAEMWLKSVTGPTQLHVFPK